MIPSFCEVATTTKLNNLTGKYKPTKFNLRIFILFRAKCQDIKILKKR